MPKEVDHQQRRAGIAEAALRLTVDEGLEAVTMRRVAAEAGVSLGQVQHYFASKDELLMVTLELISEQFTRRTGAAPAGESPRERARALLVQMLPLDEERSGEARVGVAFLARAAVAPRFAEVLRGGAAWATDFLVSRIEEGQRAGQVAAAREPRREARLLMAVVDGLTMHTLVGHHSPAEAEAALDAHLADLFGNTGSGCDRL